MYFFDPLYLLMMAPAILIAAWSSFKVRSTFAKYARVRVASGITGADAARMLLERNRIYDVTVVPSQGFLTDLYDPIRKVIRLSPDVYGGSSISAVGVACHEAGHAVQHAVGFFPVHLRNTMVPVVKISSNLSWVLIIAGMWMHYLGLAQLGVLLFSAIVVFQIVTLPVEFDASRRALVLMTEYGIVTREEHVGARRVLTAAAMTYVAAVITAVMQLLYFAMRTGLLGGRRD